MFMPQKSGIWLSFGTCGKWDCDKRVSKNEWLGKECKLTWGPRQTKEQDKFVPGWGSKQGKQLNKEKYVKVKREGRRCVWDWEETKVDMYDLTEPLSSADWPRDLSVTPLPPGLCEVQTVGRWRQGEEGVSSVVFSLRHSRHSSTRQETETQSDLQSKPNQELSPAYFLYLEAILSWQTYCYRRLFAYLICYSFFFVSSVSPWSLDVFLFKAALE